jgi:serine/threonine-protein kinase RsbW
MDPNQTGSVTPVPRVVRAVTDAAILSLEFDRGGITGARRDISGCATSAGLVGIRLEQFVLAINEIMTNAVRHGGGHGQVRLWRTAAELRCEIRDAGNGANPYQFNGYELPPSSAIGGRGLWLARTLCDTFAIDSDDTGTRVRLAMRIRPET